MAEAAFQQVPVAGKKFERSSAVLDSMWFEQVKRSRNRLAGNFDAQLEEG